MDFLLPLLATTLGFKCFFLHVPVCESEMGVHEAMFECVSACVCEPEVNTESASTTLHLVHSGRVSPLMAGLDGMVLLASLLQVAQPALSKLEFQMGRHSAPCFGGS